MIYEADNVQKALQIAALSEPQHPLLKATLHGAEQRAGEAGRHFRMGCGDGPLSLGRYAYLRDLFTKLANGHLARDIDVLMPWACAQKVDGA